MINASGTLNDSATSFTNNGTLSIDTGAAASLAISGNYTQTSTGALNVELGGTTAGTLYDQLNVSGTAVLAGSVNIALINGFTPSSGNTFQIMTFGSVSGTFATYNGTSLSNGLLLLTPSQTATAVTLTTSMAPTADLALGVTAQPAQVTLGGNLTYVVTVTNNGPNDAQGFVLTDILPSTRVGLLGHGEYGQPLDYREHGHARPGHAGRLGDRHLDARRDAVDRGYI